MIQFYYHLLYLSNETLNKRLWLRMARTEMDCDLKNSGRLTFQAVSTRLQKSIFAAIVWCLSAN